MAFNKTELTNMQAMNKEFRTAWVQGLDTRKGASVIAALAQMLEYSDIWESALVFLRERKDKYPKPVALQILYWLKKTNDKQCYKMGLRVLKGIEKKDLKAAFEAVVNTVGYESGNWDVFLRKVRRDLKKI